MELKVKDFAAMQGVSDSIIYRHIRQHKEDLGDRVIKRGNATWLTEEGQEYIRGLMTQQPIVVGDGETSRKNAELEQENKALIYELKEVYKVQAELQRQLGELQGVQARLEAAETATLALTEAKDEFKALAEKKDEEAARLREENAAMAAELAKISAMGRLQRLFYKPQKGE